MKKILFMSLCFASVAYAQPPGLQGPFVPIEVVEVTPGSSSTEVSVDYYARTDSFADLYQRESDTFDKAEVVGFASELIGTPWENATCAALKDAGYAEPCTIPPKLPEEPEYLGDGDCLASYGAAGFQRTSNNITLGACVAHAKAGVDSTGFVAEFSSMSCSGNNYTIKFDFTDNGNVVIADNPAGTFTPFAPEDYCVVPPTEAPKDDPTTDEIYEAILPAVNSLYFYDFSTKRIDNSIPQFQSTASSITNIYNSYSSQWSSGEPTSPPGYSPIPIPAPPENSSPSDSPEISIDFPEFPEPTPGQCEQFPNTLGCADASGLTGFADVPDFAAGTLAVGDTFSPVVLSTAAACPSPHQIPFLGDTVEISYEIICDLGPTVSPLFILIASLSGLFIMLKGSDA